MEQLRWELWEWLPCWDALRIPLLPAEPRCSALIHQHKDEVSSPGDIQQAWSLLHPLPRRGGSAGVGQKERSSHLVPLPNGLPGCCQCLLPTLGPCCNPLFPNGVSCARNVQVEPNLSPKLLPAVLALQAHGSCWEPLTTHYGNLPENSRAVRKAEMGNPSCRCARRGAPCKVQRSRAHPRGSFKGAEGLRSAHSCEVTLCRKAPKLHLRAVDPPVPANNTLNCSVEGQKGTFLQADFIKIAVWTRLMGYFGGLCFALDHFLQWLALRLHRRST